MLCPKQCNQRKKSRVVRSHDICARRYARNEVRASWKNQVEKSKKSLPYYSKKKSGRNESWTEKQRRGGRKQTTKTYLGHRLVDGFSSSGYKRREGEVRESNDEGAEAKRNKASRDPRFTRNGEILRVALPILEILREIGNDLFQWDVPTNASSNSSNGIPIFL